MCSALHIACGSFLVVGVALGQTTIPSEESPTAFGCPDDPTGYSLRNDAAVKTRFNLLGSLNHLIEGVSADLPQQGESYSSESALRGHAALRDAFGSDGGRVAPFRLTLIKTFYGDCSESADGTKELDVVYEIFRFSLSPPRLRLFESAQQQNEDPSRTAVDSRPANSFSLRPDAAYNASDGFGVGGVLDYALDLPGLSTIRARGHKYSQGSDGTFSFEGSSDAWSWADSAHWALAYDYSNGPSEGRDLRRSRGRAQFHATLPALRESLATRFGSSFELGNQSSTFDVATASNTLASAPYSSGKIFVGVTGRMLRHSFAASYGLQLGATKGGKSLDYYKHVGDLAWDFRQPFGDHRSIEIETALMVGKLGIPGKVPAAERFFGGDVDLAFIDAADWRIRAAPLIRSIPNRGLSRLSPDTAIGGESYVALNLTAAATGWRLPLLPDRVNREPDFQAALQLAEGQALGAMVSEYRAEVPRSDEEVAQLESIIEALPSVISELERIELEDPDKDWFECRFITADIEKTARKLSTEPGALGQVTAALEKAIQACKEDQKISNEQADGLFGDVSHLVEQMQAAYENRPAIVAATERADSEFKLPKRAIESFTNEMNLLSISPIFMFDAARIGPQSLSAGGGLRFGIGGGLRFGLASHVNFDIGYAVNPNPQSWEGRGALFFAMRFLELIR